MILGIINNAYIGLITYLLFPSLFIIGLLLIPIGWYRHKKDTGKSTRELLSDQFESDDTEAGISGSKVFKTAIILTVINIFFLGGVSIRMLHFMDEPNFCGTACHSVMNPE